MNELDIKGVSEYLKCPLEIAQKLFKVVGFPSKNGETVNSDDLDEFIYKKRGQPLFIRERGNKWKLK